jgi:hypothetical protein
MAVDTPLFAHWDDYPATRAAVQSFFRDGARTDHGSNFPNAEVKKRKSASEQRFCNKERPPRTRVS